MSSVYIILFIFLLIIISVVIVIIVLHNKQTKQKTVTTYLNKNINAIQLIDIISADQTLNINSLYNPKKTVFVIKNILFYTDGNDYTYSFQLYINNSSILDYKYTLQKQNLTIDGPTIMINPGDKTVYSISLNSVTIENNKIKSSQFAIMKN